MATGDILFGDAEDETTAIGSGVKAYRGNVEVQNEFILDVDVQNTLIAEVLV